MKNIRPDTAYTEYSRGLENPTRADVVRVKWIFRYLQCTKDVRIVYGSSISDDNSFVYFNDSSNGGDTSTGRSTLVIVCIYSGGELN